MVVQFEIHRAWANLCLFVGKLSTCLSLLWGRPVLITGLSLTHTGPLVGLKLVIYGVIRNFLLLLSVPLGVVTVIKPLVAPLGTVAVT